VFPRYELAEVIKTKNFALTEWYSKKGKMLGRMLYDHRVDPEEPTTWQKSQNIEVL
jgi:hypothetical protein